MKNLFNLWYFLDNKDKNFFILIVCFSLFQGILEMLSIAIIIPFVTILLNPEGLMDIPFISNLINIDSFELNQKTIIISCIILFSIFLIKNILILFTNKFTFKFIFNLRTKIFYKLTDKIIHQEYLFFVNKSISEIYNVTINELNNFISNIARPTITLVGEIIVFFGILILIILTGYFDALLLIFPIVIVIALILKKLSQSIKSWSERRIKSYEDLLDLNQNYVSGIKEIFIYGVAKKILTKFDNILDTLASIDTKNTIVTTYPKILLEQSIILIFSTIIIFLYYIGNNPNETIVILSFYLAVAYRLVPSLNKIFISYQQIKYGRPSADRIFEYYNLIKQNEYLENESKESNILDFKKKIELKNIDFKYNNNKSVIENLNLSINKNEIIGFFGESGSGKSTLINIITNLIKPSKGEILIDNQKVDNLKLIRKYQNLFSISSQDTFIIGSTIKDNILFGSKKEFSQSKMDTAIKFAQLQNFIKELPDGLDTEIGLAVKQLSSGQKQRITIARTIYNDREIMIFDEATNALDEVNEKKIFENIKNLRLNKTIIIISHNKKNLEICDKKFLIENKVLKLI
tara:strand:+ start:973 stop:2703 length:1731 start_codon:yes stop_codon:yes gene_type:complete